MHDEKIDCAFIPSGPAPSEYSAEETALAFLLWNTVDQFNSRVRVPILHEGWIYATDGRVAVRCPATPRLIAAMEYCEFGDFSSQMMRGATLRNTFETESWDERGSWAPLLRFPRALTWDDETTARTLVRLESVAPSIHIPTGSSTLYNADFLWPLAQLRNPRARVYREHLQVLFDGGQAMVMACKGTFEEGETYTARERMACGAFGRIAFMRRTVAGQTRVDSYDGPRLDVTHLGQDG